MRGGTPILTRPRVTRPTQMYLERGYLWSRDGEKTGYHTAKQHAKEKNGNQLATLRQDLSGVIDVLGLETRDGTYLQSGVAGHHGDDVGAAVGHEVHQGDRLEANAFLRSGARGRGIPPGSRCSSRTSHPCPSGRRQSRRDCRSERSRRES